MAQVNAVRAFCERRVAVPTAKVVQRMVEGGHLEARDGMLRLATPESASVACELSLGALHIDRKKPCGSAAKRTRANERRLPRGAPRWPQPIATIGKTRKARVARPSAVASLTELLARQ